LAWCALSAGALFAFGSRFVMAQVTFARLFLVSFSANGQRRVRNVAIVLFV
jgi:hypothetical protein